MIAQRKGQDTGRHTTFIASDMALIAGIYHTSVRHVNSEQAAPEPDRHVHMGQRLYRLQCRSVGTLKDILVIQMPLLWSREREKQVW